jgi:hypothetical protein
MMKISTIRGRRNIGIRPDTTPVAGVILRNYLKMKG